VLAAEHLLGFAGIDLRGQIVERAAEIVSDRLAGLGPFGEDGEVVETGSERGREIPILFEPPAPLEQLLRGRLILPEVSGPDAILDLLQLPGGLCGVKDSSAGRWRAGPGPRTCEAVRPTGKPNLNSCDAPRQMWCMVRSRADSPRRNFTFYRKPMSGAARRVASSAATVSASDSHATASPMRL
jgi:hypothetical protein